MKDLVTIVPMGLKVDRGTGLEGAPPPSQIRIQVRSFVPVSQCYLALFGEEGWLHVQKVSSGGSVLRNIFTIKPTLNPSLLENDNSCLLLGSVRNANGESKIVSGWKGSASSLQDGRPIELNPI